MVEIFEITMEQVRVFSDRSNTLVTVDAPLFGSVCVMKGRVLNTKMVEDEKLGHTIGFPPSDQIVAEASRFWIQHANGVWERKSRKEMALLLDTK